jgi:hypothetical protein
MNAIVRTTTDKYGAGTVVLLADNGQSAYTRAASEIKAEWLPEISIPDAQDFEQDGERIVQELRDELDMLLELDGRELVEAWNRSPLNNPDEFDTSRHIGYPPAPIQPSA